MSKNNYKEHGEKSSFINLIKTLNEIDDEQKLDDLCKSLNIYLDETSKVYIKAEKDGFLRYFESSALNTELLFKYANEKVLYKVISSWSFITEEPEPEVMFYLFRGIFLKPEKKLLDLVLNKLEVYSKEKRNEIIGNLEYLNGNSALKDFSKSYGDVDEFKRNFQSNKEIYLKLNRSIESFYTIIISNLLEERNTKIIKKCNESLNYVVDNLIQDFEGGVLKIMPLPIIYSFINEHGDVDLLSKIMKVKNIKFSNDKNWACPFDYLVSRIIESGEGKKIIFSEQDSKVLSLFDEIDVKKIFNENYKDKISTFLQESVLFVKIGKANKIEEYFKKYYSDVNDSEILKYFLNGYSYYGKLTDYQFETLISKTFSLFDLNKPQNLQEVNSFFENRFDDDKNNFKVISGLYRIITTKAKLTDKNLNSVIKTIKKTYGEKEFAMVEMMEMKKTLKPVKEKKSLRL